MDISLFLAKVLGLYFLIVALAMIFNHSTIKVLMLDILNNPPLLFVSGFIALIIGLLLVVSHNLWVMDWRLLITISAWLSLVKGIVRVAFPKTALKASQTMIQNDTAYYISSFIVLVLGVCFLYFGFIAS